MAALTGSGGSPGTRVVPHRAGGYGRGHEPTATLGVTMATHPNAGSVPPDDGTTSGSIHDGMPVGRLATIRLPR